MNNFDALKMYADLEKNIDEKYNNLDFKLFHLYCKGLLDGLKISVPSELYIHYILYIEKYYELQKDKAATIMN